MIFRPSGEGKVVLIVLMAATMAAVVSWLGKRADASALACEAVKDADQRHYCRACSRGDTNECELIRNSDLRAQCRALCARPR